MYSIEKRIGAHVTSCILITSLLIWIPQQSWGILMALLVQQLQQLSSFTQSLQDTSMWPGKMAQLHSNKTSAYLSFSLVVLTSSSVCTVMCGQSNSNRYAYSILLFSSTLHSSHTKFSILARCTLPIREHYISIARVHKYMYI